MQILSSSSKASRIPARREIMASESRTIRKAVMGIEAKVAVRHGLDLILTFWGEILVAASFGMLGISLENIFYPIHFFSMPGILNEVHTRTIIDIEIS
jgi:hypothetical protein